MGKDTILPNMLNHEFKILHYIDTIGCTNCHLQLFDWKLYMKELKSSSIDIALIFVVFTKNYEEFEIIQRNNHFFYPVIYDYNGLLNKKNQFPTYPYPLHTFLLDRNNKVLANKEVRQAINYAIDKNTIISKELSNNYFASNFILDYGSYLYQGNEENPRCYLYRRS